jgi:pimeloyl-ACP methyl ester carboxylesterase
VIRYDNRDCGLSTRMERFGLPDMRAAFIALGQGRAPGAPYSLEDMAADAIGLLDALEITQAHVVGASMGGMIAQLVAAHYPERVLSLTSIMSTTGNPMLPAGKPQALSVLVSPSPREGDTEAIVEHGFNAYRTVGSPGFPTEEKVLRQRVREDAMRGYYPQGILRQMAAVMTNGDRRSKLKRIKVPTVVLHGADDPLMPVEAGKDTAANIPGAELRVIQGMGHDLPLELVPQFVDAILAAAQRGSPRPAAKPRREKAQPSIISEIALAILPEPKAEPEPESEAAPHRDMPETEARQRFLTRLRSWWRQAPD